MRFTTLAAAAALSLVQIVPAQAQPDDLDAIMAASAALDRIAWMAGSWEGEHRQLQGVPLTWTEEYWSAPRGAIMIGFGRRGQGVRLGMYEHLLIMGDEAGRLAYHADAGDGAPVVFPLVRSTAQEAVFENPTHDFPQRIAYRRNGDRMTATISRIDGSGARSWTFRRRSGR